MTTDLIYFVITMVITIAIGIISYFLKRTMDKIDRLESEVRDSVNYLSESGYINMRKIDTKESTTLADCDFNEIEAKVSADGIKIIACVRSDECIDV